ncbi:hypothetical protein D9M69_713100 [compost metagenome]
MCLEEAAHGGCALRSFRFHRIQKCQKLAGGDAERACLVGFDATDMVPTAAHGRHQGCGIVIVPAGKRRKPGRNQTVIHR